MRFWETVQPNSTFNTSDQLKGFNESRYANLDDAGLSTYWSEYVATADFRSSAAIDHLVAFNRMIYDSSSEETLRALIYGDSLYRQPSPNEAIERLLALSRSTYESLDDEAIDEFFGDHIVAFEPEENNAVDRLVAFDRSLYRNLESDEFSSYWADYFSARAQTKNYLVERLVSFDRKIYETLEPDAFSELWTSNILNGNQPGNTTNDRLMSFNQAAYVALGDGAVTTLWEQSYEQPPDDIIDRLVDFKYATYESFDTQALGLLLVASPASKWSTWFSVPQTGEEVLVGIDVSEFADVSPDDLFFLTRTPIEVECRELPHCGKRFISWYPHAKINILEASPAEPE